MAQKETAEVEIVLSNGKQAGKSINELTGTVVKLNREVKNLTPGTAEFETKTKDLQKVQGRLNDVRKEVKGVDQATQDLKGEFGNLIPFNAQFQQFKGTFGNLITSLRGAATASNVLKVAMIAIPIMLIVAALGAMYKWLTSTQEGMDKLTSVTRPLSAIFQRLIGVVQTLGGTVFKALAEAVKNPKQAMIDLGNAIQENVMNRFTALAKFAPAIGKIFSKDWQEGLKDLANATLQVGTGVEGAIEKIGNASKETGKFLKESIEVGKQIDQLTKTIEKNENALIVSRAELNKKYQEGKEIAQDLTKSDSERIKGAKDSQAAQNELLNQEQNLLDLKIAKQELIFSQNDTSREDEKQLQQLRAESIEFEATAAKKRASAKSLENSASKEAATAESKRLSDRQKQTETLAAKELAYKRSVEDLKISLIEDTGAREIAELNLNTERKIEALTGSEEQITEQKLLLEQVRDQQLSDYRAEKEKEQKALDLEKKELEYEESLIEDEEEKIRIQEKFDAVLITAAEHDEIIYQQEKAALERKLALIAEINGRESLEYKKANLDILKLDAERQAEVQENAQKTAEFKAAMESKQFDATKDVFGGIADLLSQDEKIRKKHAGVIKTMKIAETTMGVIKEVQSIWETSAQLGPIAGPILGAIQTGLAIGRGAIAVGKISATKFSLGGRIKDAYKYAKGFLPKGPSHAQGGIAMIDSSTGSQVGEMEGDEPILTKGVGKTPFLRSMVNYVNQAAGGRRIYAEGGVPSMPVPINPLSGASNPNQAAQNIQTEQLKGIRENDRESNQSSVQLLSAFQSYAAKVDQWARTLRVVNDPRDTDSALSDIKQVENDASI